jgi:hypothetical protein
METMKLFWAATGAASDKLQQAGACPLSWWTGFARGGDRPLRVLAGTLRESAPKMGGVTLPQGWLPR